MDDGWLKDDDVLGAADVALQMEALGLDGEAAGGSSSQANVAGSGKKKKKQKQKITLMSTGGRRGG